MNAVCSSRRVWWMAAAGVVVAIGGGALFLREALTPPPTSLPSTPTYSVVEATSEEVHEVCGACHTYPPADSFPRHLWRHEVKRGFDFLRQSRFDIPYPSSESVALYYEKRAPVELPVPEPTYAPGPCPARFETTSWHLPGENKVPAVSNVNIVHLSDAKQPEVLVCDMRGNRVLALKPNDPFNRWRVLGEVSYPAHAEVVDLDGDGIKDILVACLGSFYPTDDKVGSVVWLKGEADGTFTPITLLDGIGRVADVQAADFRKCGKLDLVVAEFGWLKTGEVLYLENRTTDWSRPNFVPRVVDDRHGAIHVPVGDIDGDGNLDFVALISQEHETIVAFLGRGDGTFRKETIWAGPHPAYGSSGIQLVDLNGDKKLDVLYTNGDVLDTSEFLKPYQGVQWLENRGVFPFTHHPLAVMPGAHRAVAADIDGDGDLDVIAVSLLPDRKGRSLDSIILLEQTAPGTFVRHSLEKDSCDHITCAAGDLYGDGRAHFIIGDFVPMKNRPLSGAVRLWKNRGHR